MSDEEKEWCEIRKKYVPLGEALLYEPTTGKYITRHERGMYTEVTLAKICRKRGVYPPDPDDVKAEEEQEKQLKEILKRLRGDSDTT